MNSKRSCCQRKAENWTLKERSSYREYSSKQLLVYGPPHVLWVITGSSMALVWLSMARAPTNGHCLLHHCTELVLPAIVGADQMQLVWEHLVGPAIQKVSDAVVGSRPIPVN